MAFDVVVEHLNHLGIVAEVCREIGVAEWLDAQVPTSRQRVIPRRVIPLEFVARPSRDPAM